MQRFTPEDVRRLVFDTYRKRGVIRARRVNGPFEVEHGGQAHKCEDGYLVRLHGEFPVAVPRVIFETEYMLMGGHTMGPLSGYEVEGGS